MPDLPRADKLPAITKRRQAFVDQLVLLGDPVAAYLAAGYKDAGKHNRWKARELQKLLKTHIDVAFRDHLTSTDQAMRAYASIDGLAVGASSEAVRLQAAKDVMTRAGYDRPTEVTVNHNHRNLSDEEIEARMAAIRAELGLEGRDVTPAIEGECVAVGEDEDWLDVDDDAA